MRDRYTGVRWETGILVSGERQLYWCQVRDRYTGVRWETAILVSGEIHVYWCQVRGRYTGVRWETCILVSGKRQIYWCQVRDRYTGVRWEIGILVSGERQLYWCQVRDKYQICFTRWARCCMWIYKVDCCVLLYCDRSRSVPCGCWNCWQNTASSSGRQWWIKTTSRSWKGRYIYIASMIISSESSMVKPR